MKKQLLLTSSLLLTATAAQAGPGVFVGVSYDFGGSVGISLKVLSTNVEHRGAVAAGVSYFPTIKTFGIDAGAGYVFKNGAVTLGWDFLNKSAQTGLGYVNTKSNNQVVPPAPVPPPPLGSGGGT